MNDELMLTGGFVIHVEIIDAALRVHDGFNDSIAGGIICLPESHSEHLGMKVFPIGTLVQDAILDGSHIAEQRVSLVAHHSHACVLSVPDKVAVPFSNGK
jgi:hypothetical protein